MTTLVLPIPPMFSGILRYWTRFVARARQRENLGSGPESLTCESVGLNCGRVRGGVAQLVRASACHAEGRGFESRRSRHVFKHLAAFRRPQIDRFDGPFTPGVRR